MNIRRLYFFSLLGGGLFLALLFTGGYLWLHGDIPKIVDTNEVIYEKTIDIKPSFGKIWFASSGWREPVYYFRLHLTQTDFDATAIGKLQKIPRVTENGVPIWWNPSRKAQCFIGPPSDHGFNGLYAYDAKRNLLFVRGSL